MRFLCGLLLPKAFSRHQTFVQIKEWHDYSHARQTNVKPLITDNQLLFAMYAHIRVDRPVKTHTCSLLPFFLAALSRLQHRFPIVVASGGKEKTKMLIGRLSAKFLMAQPLARLLLSVSDY